MSTLDDALYDHADEAPRHRVDVDLTGGSDAEHPRTAADEIRRARFREKLRGYHPDDVDHFLEQFALRVEELESRLDDSLGRLKDAEERAAVATAGEQTVRRTLTLAQRTAELAIAEAQDRAAQIVAEAEDEAATRIAQVEREVSDTRAREAGRLEAELARLQEATDAATKHLAVLEARRTEEHQRIVAILDELRTLVDARLRADTPVD